MRCPRPARFTLPLWLAFAGCHVSIDSDGDAGPVKSESRSVERGKAESVRATIHMGAGELTIKGGATKLLNADFRASHMPEIIYDAGGTRGTLEIRGPKKSNWGNQRENAWRLKFDDRTPLDLVVHLGAGETDLDLSTLELRSLEVHMGVGELKLNLDGDYQRRGTRRDPAAAQDGRAGGCQGRHGLIENEGAEAGERPVRERRL
jgi:hypothetical protein